MYAETVENLNERIAGLVAEMSVMKPTSQGYKDRRVQAEDLAARRKRIEAK